MIFAAMLLAYAQPVAEIRYEMTAHHMYVPVTVDGKGPLSFIVDTGAAATVIDDAKAKDLGLKPAGSAAGGGAGGGKVTATIYPAVKVTVAGLTAPERPIFGIPLASATRLVGRPIDGVLGYDFLSRYVVEFDYAGRRIRLYEPATYRYEGKGEKLPFKLVVNHVRVTGTAVGMNDARAEGDFTIDTGAANSITLATHFVDAHGLLAPEQKALPTIPLGEGAGGVSVGIRSRLKELRLGGIVVNHPITDFSRDTAGYFAGTDLAGTVGYEVLGRFKVIVDYSRKELILEPGPAAADWREPGVSGLAFEADPPTFHPIRVRLVTKGTAAERAGIQVGDVLVEANGRPAAQCTLEELRKMMERPGDRMRLVLQRGGDTVHAELVVEAVK